jgi:hypothetical protein
VGICAALAFEGALTTLWFSSFSWWAAWGIGLLNAGFLAWMWYAHRPGSKSTLRIGTDGIEVVLSRRTRFRFPHTAVATVELATWRSVVDVVPDYLNTAHPLEPNVLITMDRPIEVRFAIGVTKGVRRIGVRVEDADGVVIALRAPIASGQTRS